MISAWWVVVAFIAGGYAGLLLMALMRFASEQSGRDAAIDVASGAGWRRWPGRHPKHYPL